LGAASKPFERSLHGESGPNIAEWESVESRSLSLRERVRVRGNAALLSGRQCTFPATIEPCESFGKAEGFPKK